MDDIRITLTHPDLMPLRQRAGDAGADLKAAESLVIEPGGIAFVSTGVCIAIPYGYVGYVFLRGDMGGLVIRNDIHGILLMNQLLVINHQDRGVIFLPLRNTGEKPFEIRFGDRIAQLVIQRVELPGFDLVKNIPLFVVPGSGNTGI